MNQLDSHQHFWDLDRQVIPQLRGAPAVLQRSYRPADLQPHLAAHGITGTILVQGYPQDDATNRWYFELANRTEFVRGVVAWADLTNLDRLRRQLDELQAQPKFVGLRHIIEDEPDDDWLARPDVLRGLAELAARGVPYDLLVKSRSLPHAVRVARELPGLTLILDHLAKPTAWEGWAEQIEQLAGCPNVACKLSSLITQPVDMTRYVQHARQCFGPARLMFGSDWPVCRMAGEYTDVWTTLEQALGPLTATERAAIYGGTAMRTYRL
jgi:L-fuconolactonase